MKKKNNGYTQKNFYKVSHYGGISLIVLVITIIVVIILAAAVIISLQNNNPMVEAKKAKIKSDVANMQAIFTNTVGKIMAEKQEVIGIVPNRLNEPTSNKKNVVGETTYTINNEIVGKIIFDNKQNNGVDYYTGRKLPVYNKETTWYVDDAGILRLQIDDETYGEGQIKFNESIKIEVNVMPNNNFTKATLEVIIEYEGEIDSVTINGEKLEVVKNAEGKYVGSKDVSENGTYSIEVIAKDGSKNKSEIKVNELADNMEIWNKADMENFRDKVNSGASFVDKKVQVMDDIYLDCSETNQWVPINNFDGTLDGNNHSINGIYVNTSESKIGFFKILSQTSSIQNIKLENVNINGKSEVGGLAAYNYSKNIQNCSVSGNISGNTNVGGLVGVSEGLTSNILNCSVSADVTGDFTVGGVVALNKSVIKYCGKSGSTTARVTENDFSMVGGIVGELQRRLFIFLC